VAQQGKSDDLVPLQELAVSNVYEMAALVPILERKGLVAQQEVLEEIKRLTARTGTVRENHHQRR
jgi:hypothetical protein